MKAETERANVVTELQHMCTIPMNSRYVELVDTSEECDGTSIDLLAGEEYKKGPVVTPVTVDIFGFRGL
ncbi:hypothetical protein NDU88_006211 [Pleurodeles waltl]|uniref:Uncharacterized protein n=1 Tax=Pleurodeles waltl TaxID=8319 RepID=A0AAV7X1Z2_PLEWA|nr:hypothetical protein NDU88_006211 [Pleurodeles waltl]